MPQNRLDPEHADAVMFGVKLGKSDADRVIELARRAGLGRSAYLRSVVLDALREEPERRLAS